MVPRGRKMAPTGSDQRPFSVSRWLQESSFRFFTFDNERMEPYQDVKAEALLVFLLTSEDFVTFCRLPALLLA